MRSLTGFTRQLTVTRLHAWGGRVAVCLALLGGGSWEVLAATDPPTAGLAVWLRADAGVTVTSGKVSAWADQSGGGRNAAQATATARPTLVTNALNGKPVISFNGTNTYLSLTYPVNGLTGITIVMVSNNAVSQVGGQWGNENAALFWAETASWGEVHLSPFQTNVRFRFGTGQQNNLPSYSRPASIGSAYSRTIAVKNGTTDSLYVNGTRVLNLSGKLGTIANSQSAATIGRGGSPTIKYFNGNIAEIMVYNRALSSAELATVNTYLAEKYFPAAGAPAAPTGLVASAGNQQASLSWNGSAGAASYSVKRSTTSGSGYADLATGLTSTSYVDGGLTNGVTYYYVVTATNAQGTSGNSNQASAVPAPAPAAPTGLVASAGDQQVSLSWNTSAGATSYTVRRSTTSGSGYANVATGLTATSYVDGGLANGITYYYVVTATNAQGTSGNSNQVSAVPAPAPGGTGPPTAGLAVWLRADAGVTVASGKVSAWADQSGGGRHATQATATARPTLVANALNGKPVISFNGTSTYLSFTYPVNGLTGMTVVMVSNSAASQSGGQWGNENAALFWAETASWGEVHLSPFQTNVRFRFGTGQTNNLPSYTRPASLGSAYSRTVALKSGTTDSLYVNGTRVLNLSGKLGTIANSQSAATIGRGGAPTIKYFNGNIAEIMVYNRALSAAELATVDVYLTQKYFAPPGPPAAPTGLVANAGDRQVGLAWNASAGAASYSVKRSTTSGSGYADVATGLTSTSYVDGGLTNGVTYYYVVTATNAQGTSGNSNQASAVPTPNGAAAAITRSGTGLLLDGQPFTMWGMRVASASQTQALTDQLIANLDAYKVNGLNTITVFYQGSSGGFVDPFTADGLSMDPGHRSRMDQIVRAARTRGMVVIVGILYQRAVWVMNSATSVHNAMRTVASLMVPYRNVIINVVNEGNAGQYSDTNGIYNVGIPANIGALCADVHSIDPARLCGGGEFNDSYNVGVGLNANIDVLLFSTDNVTPTGFSKYDYFVSQGINNKPILNVELYGGYTLNWPTPGVFDATAKGFYQNEVLAKNSRPGLSIFFFSEPWLQGTPIHFELGGQGTAADPGIKWYWDYVLQNGALSAFEAAADGGSGFRAFTRRPASPAASSAAGVEPDHNASRWGAAGAGSAGRLAQAEVLFDLAAPEPADRAAAVARVGELAPGDALEVLSAIFAAEEDFLVRSRAIAALTRVDVRGATALLRRWAREDAAPALRAQALNAVAATSGRRSTTVFGRALHMDADLEVRLTAIRMLERVGGAMARGYLERAAQDAGRRISRAAEQALAAWPESLE